MITRTILADARAAAGDWRGGADALAEAEALHKALQADLPRLYSLQGYQLSDRLLAAGRAGEAMTLSAWSLPMARRMNIALDIGLDQLTLARAGFAQSRLPPLAGGVASGASQGGHGVTRPFVGFADTSPASGGGGPEAALAPFLIALAALRRANQEAYIVPGLLALAEAAFHLGEGAEARAALSEAEAIATRGPMPLFAAQAAILRARMALAEGDMAAARAKRDEADAIITETGWRDGAPRLAVLDAEMGIGAPSAAEDLIIESFWFSLLPRLEALGYDCARGRVAEKHYNEERDAYLRTTLAEDVEGYDPRNDPIAAYLGIEYPPKPESEGVGVKLDQIPDEVAQHILDTPELRAQLSGMLAQAQVAPLEESSTEQQLAYAKAFAAAMIQAQKQSEEKEAEPQIPDAMVRQIFDDPAAQDLLREAMRQNNLTGAPQDLPFEAQRALVLALVKAGAIQLGEQPAEGDALGGLDPAALGLPPSVVARILADVGDDAAARWRRLHAAGANVSALTEALGPDPDGPPPKVKRRWWWPFGGTVH